jgi:hypothetical protein
MNIEVEIIHKLQHTPWTIQRPDPFRNRAFCVGSRAAYPVRSRRGRRAFTVCALRVPEAFSLYCIHGPVRTRKIPSLKQVLLDSQTRPPKYNE